MDFVRVCKCEDSGPWRRIYEGIMIQSYFAGIAYLTHAR